MAQVKKKKTNGTVKKKKTFWICRIGHGEEFPSRQVHALNQKQKEMLVFFFNGTFFGRAQRDGAIKKNKVG